MAKNDVPAHPAHGPGRIAASVYVTRIAFASGTSEWRLSPSGLLAQPVAIGFKKANANHVSNTNPEITS